MTAYLTPLQWRTRTIMPSGDCDALDIGEPGFIAARLAFHQGKSINGRLAKRYASEDAARLVNGILGRIAREAA